MRLLIDLYFVSFKYIKKSYSSQKKQRWQDIGIFQSLSQSYVGKKEVEPRADDILKVAEGLCGVMSEYVIKWWPLITYFINMYIFSG